MPKTTVFEHQFLVFPGRVAFGEGQPEYIPVGLTTASLRSTPPPDATQPSRVDAENGYAIGMKRDV